MIQFLFNSGLLAAAAPGTHPTGAAGKASQAKQVLPLRADFAALMSALVPGKAGGDTPALPLIEDLENLTEQVEEALSGILGSPVTIQSLTPTPHGFVFHLAGATLANSGEGPQSDESEGKALPESFLVLLPLVADKNLQSTTLSLSPPEGEEAEETPVLVLALPPWVAERIGVPPSENDSEAEETAPASTAINTTEEEQSPSFFVRTPPPTGSGAETANPFSTGTEAKIEAEAKPNVPTSPASSIGVSLSLPAGGGKVQETTGSIPVEIPVKPADAKTVVPTTPGWAPPPAAPLDVVASVVPANSTPETVSLKPVVVTLDGEGKIAAVEPTLADETVPLAKTPAQANENPARILRAQSNLKGWAKPTPANSNQTKTTVAPALAVSLAGLRETMEELGVKAIQVRKTYSPPSTTSPATTPAAAILPATLDPAAVEVKKVQFAQAASKGFTKTAAPEVAITNPTPQNLPTGNPIVLEPSPVAPEGPVVNFDRQTIRLGAPDEIMNRAPRSVEESTEPVRPTNEIEVPKTTEATGRTVAKTTAPAANSPVTDVEVLDQVVRAVRVNRASAGTEIRVRLTPESLGEVHLKVSISDGVLIAELKAGTEMTREILSRQSQALETILRDSGLQVERVIVRTSSIGSDSNAPQNGLQKEDLSEQERTLEDRERSDRKGRDRGRGQEKDPNDSSPSIWDRWESVA